jgi:hypothetical protein
VEDPVSFDLWGKIVSDKRSIAIKEISSLRPTLMQIEVRILVNNSIFNDDHILVVGNKGLDFVQTFQALSIDWLEDMCLYQYGCQPQDKTRYCKLHKLHYGGCLGCHICTGFFMH